MPRKTGIIQKVQAVHYAHSKYTGRLARLTLWATTDTDHEVWLASECGIGSRGIESKIARFEELNEHLRNQQIEYLWKERDHLGFIRKYLTSKPAQGYNEGAGGIYHEPEIPKKRRRRRRYSRRGWGGRSIIL
jgi:hypothetical protein